MGKGKRMLERSKLELIYCGNVFMNSCGDKPISIQCTARSRSELIFGKVKLNSFQWWERSRPKAPCKLARTAIQDNVLLGTTKCSLIIEQISAWELKTKFQGCA
jgi:hypothetical protein